MQVINCKQIRQNMLTEAKMELAKILANTGKVLKLVVVQVGSDPASSTYIKNKIKTCEECGVECEHFKLPESISVGDLKRIISATCDDNKVDGVMLQLPLPEHLKKYEQSLLDAIPWDKDVDALSTNNIGRLWNNKPCITPATAQGVLRLLPDDLSGKNICILGRSNLVGKPLVKLLMDRNATVTVCHSYTDSITDHISNSDIVISAIGLPKYIKYQHTINNNGYSRCKFIIDVGINRDENGKLCGDVDIDDFENSYIDITPVPGGVGQLTTAQLILNIVKAYRLQNGDLYESRN